MQQTYGYSACEAGLRILPVTAAVVLAAPIADRLAATRYPSYVWILPLSGLGVGLTMTTMTAAVMDAVPAERAGMASATTSIAREVGGNFARGVGAALLRSRRPPHRYIGTFEHGGWKITRGPRS